MDQRVAQFSEISKKRWDYLTISDSTQGNECFDELLSIAKELQDKGKLLELCILLVSENEGVQFEAASKLLSLNLEEAEKTLEKLTENKGILPFSAKMTLRQWRAGNLKF